MLSLRLCAGGRKTSNNNTNNIARKVILIKKNSRSLYSVSFSVFIYESFVSAYEEPDL